MVPGVPPKTGVCPKDAPQRVCHKHTPENRSALQSACGHRAGLLFEQIRIPLPGSPINPLGRSAPIVYNVERTVPKTRSREWQIH